MSKASKFSFLFSGLFAVAVVVARLILNGWEPFMWVPLGLSLALFVFAIVYDAAFLLEFLTMRTTKHGMNMGGLILTVVVLLVAINIVAVTNEKKWDWTTEGLNSLSEQSLKAVESLSADTELVLLYRKGQGDDQVRRQVQDLAQLYMNASKKLSLKMFNAYERVDWTSKLEYKDADGPFALYLVQGDRHLKVDQPSEEEMTRTLLRLSRSKKKHVYVVAGHGEMALTSTGPQSISDFKRDLELSYDVKSLELFKDPKIPEDAELVIVVGPKLQFLAPEIEALRSYAKRGGKLFFGLDPDGKHGLAGLLKAFGIEYQNDFVLDPRAMIPGAGNIAAIGSEFSTTAEATKPLRDGFTLFLVASALKRAPDASKDFIIDEILRTDETPIATPTLVNNPTVRVKGPHILGMQSKGKLDGSEKEFEVIVYGDGDFVRDDLYRKNLNRDLAMNSVSSLAKDSDLVSIRPKSPKGTTLTMTNTQLMIVLFGFLLPVPILLFFTSGLLWWRRKAA